MIEHQDTEFTLTTGKLIGLFFGLAAVCAFFFGFGYMLGHGSGKQEGSLIDAQNQMTAANTPKTQQPQQNTKPGDCPAGQICPPPPQDLTFYKNVEQKDANAQLTPSENPAQNNPAPELPAASQPLAKPSAPEPQKAAPAPVTQAPGAGYMVQVAAVSKREDADLLRSALQGKQYPVLITSAPNDKLFHVQVGPFAELKDAEAMKSRLVNDGYNPILKR